ncbi:hypothetical protein Plim_1156 [Planctopirus limnophila DSM 3776]|uniref:Uncharacterized protein n=1 Tax=Planctopirus limnophila (strain ATCC 43296 / DSM 3776 / IFAM 1008 / Mu 290) TaxID=521674 RepID=D5SU06_PLAL2|nr:suppressor of fused domain protein [Planctopirus limnophila]ADG66991.1 hypothetical protein Plim_1156 [Planctopirus limnophila DSM 3776]
MSDQPLEEGEDSLESQWYAEKSARMVELLGEEHDMVMHAIIPYAVGGGLDLYYYPHLIPGTGIATKELSNSPSEGSTNNVFTTYEFVMFTRHDLSLEDAQKPETPFGKMHYTINAILNMMAPYSAQAKLNPFETVEFPSDMEVVGGRCLILDAYGMTDAHADFGLMLIMEIHRVEMDYARQHGGQALLEKLMAANYYPYSDLDRPPVVEGQESSLEKLWNRISKWW